MTDFRVGGVRVVGPSSSAIIHIVTDKGVALGRTLCGYEAVRGWHVDDGDEAELRPLVNCKRCLAVEKCTSKNVIDLMVALQTSLSKSASSEDK